MKTFLNSIIVSFIFVLVLSNIADAQIAGTLDSSFNDTGIFTLDIGKDNMNDVTMQVDKKIVCTGVTLSPSYTGELKVVRLNEDGTLDNTFATNGVFTYVITTETYGYESFIRSDGKIVVAGIAAVTFGYYDMLLLRLNSDGTLDSTFGTNGSTVAELSVRDDFAYAVAQQADGKIVVAGTILDTINYYNNPSIVRFTENGIIDSTFGVNGVVTIPAVDIDNELTSIAVQADGKIVAAGHYSKVFDGSMDFDVLVIRVDANGVLDATFGTDGVVKTSINDGIDDSFGMELDADQNIVVAGFTTMPFTLTLDMVLMKYDNTGTLDPNFGNAGIVTFDNDGASDYANDLKIQPDNKIVVGGSTGLSFGERELAVWRYLSDGNRDSTFGTNGFVTTSINPEFQDFNSIALTSDGKIVAAGKTFNGTSNDIAVVRYNGGDLATGETNISQNERNNQLQLYPNPSNGQFIVIIDVEELSISEATLEIVNVLGQIVFAQKAPIVGGRLQESIKLPDNLSSGQYLVRAQVKSKEYSTQLLFQK